MNEIEYIQKLAAAGGDKPPKIDVVASVTAEIAAIQQEPQSPNRQNIQLFIGAGSAMAAAAAVVAISIKMFLSAADPINGLFSQMIMVTQ